MSNRADRTLRNAEDSPRNQPTGSTINQSLRLGSRCAEEQYGLSQYGAVDRRGVRQTYFGPLSEVFVRTSDGTLIRADRGFRIV